MHIGVGVTCRGVVGVVATHVVLGEESATHAVAQAIGLVEYLLQHVMGESSLVEHVEIHVDGLHRHVYVLVSEVGDVEWLTGMTNGDLLIIHIHHILRVLGDGSGVGGDEKLAIVLTNANHHRRALACGHQGAGIALVEHGYGVCADTLAQGMAHRLSEVAMVGLLRIFDEVDEHLGVGVAIEMEPTLLQLVAKQGEVLDDAIVNDDKIA